MTEAEEKKIILPPDECAAKFVTGISGWVDRFGRFFGNNPDSERMARYSSSTNDVCRKCGATTSHKGWLLCDKCNEEKNIEEYNNLPFKEYDGDIIYSDYLDKYFSDDGEFLDYCADEDLNPSEMRLRLCTPNKFGELDLDYFCDELPEDSELPKELEDAINRLNEVIRSLPPASYSPGKIRTTIIG